MAEKYKELVEKELDAILNKIIGIIEDLSKQIGERLEAEEDSRKKKLFQEDQVFYLKVIGDYYRYLTDTFQNDTYRSECNEVYKGAIAIARATLDVTHSIRLGLALNYSVCLNDIFDKPKEAYALAMKAHSEAKEKLGNLPSTSHKDSTMLVQLLKDNLTIWDEEDEIAQTKKD